jgi:tRNA-dihydrouridine synthase
MISAAGLLSGGPFEDYYLDGGPCPQHLVYQLLGAEPETLARAAALLESRPCLGIDVNMGCAAPAITRTGGGVRLMADADKAAAIIAAVRRVTKKRLSVKLRLGVRKKPQATRTGEPDLPGFDYLLAFCKRLVDEGADYIALHPRWGDEKFKRPARWDYVDALRKELSPAAAGVAACAAACGTAGRAEGTAAGVPAAGIPATGIPAAGIPVAGNGDISSADELAARLAGGPVMIGRLAVKEPWVFATANYTDNKVSGSFLEETALRFLELLARYQPPEFHLSRARRFFRYYCDNFTWAEYLRNKINREESLTGMGKVISEYCRENR